jgi:2-oxoglutarate ferredoxin oxidoreductase subunit alpha
LQECFDLTIEAFNLSEMFRMPVLVMCDEVVGHMTEKVVIPRQEDIHLMPRRKPSLPPGEFLAFQPKEDLVPEMPIAGEGYFVHVTGLTHNEKGYPVITPEAQEKLVRRLVDKVRLNVDRIIRLQKENLDDADVVVISYGISARTSKSAVEMARAKGLRVGFLRLITVWPFPENLIRELGRRVSAFVVPEINFGQMAREVERCAGGRARTIAVTHAGGAIHHPGKILSVIEEAIQAKSTAGEKETALTYR